MNDREFEALHILQEECAEVVQAVSKCFRFGLDNAKKDRTNRSHLEEELGDLLAMIDMAVELNLVKLDNLEIARINKKTKLAKWSNLIDKS